MKIKLFLALLIGLAFAPRLNAACSGSHPNLTAATWADVALCHTAASHGATITVTAGSYTVSANTAITKYVRIVASGTVTLTDNVPDVDDLITITESDQGHTLFQGFIINQGSGQHLNPNGVIRLVHATGGLAIVVKNNNYTTGSTGDMIVAGVNRGVITGNTNTGTAGLGGGTCSNTAAFVRHKNTALTSVWTEGPYYGDDDINGDKNLYIENNTITNVFEGIDVDANARSVIRHNTITNSGVLNHGVDTGDTSGRYMEIYSNTFVWDTTARCSGNPAGVNSFIYLRGAPALIHDNVIPNVTSMAWGDKSEITFTDEKLRRNSGTYGCWTGGYPSRQQVGWGYSTGGTQAGTTGEYQDLEPVYLWSNTGAGNYGSPNVVDYSPNECGGGAASALTYIVEDREYYLDTAKPGYDEYTYPHPLTTGQYYYAAKLCSGGVAAPACSNTNDGLTRATAELTVAAGLTHLASGDTLIIGDGTYDERIWNSPRPPSGSSGAPTTIKAENRNLAILKPTVAACCYVIAIEDRSYITIDGIVADGTAPSSTVCRVYANVSATATHNIFQNGTCRNGHGAESTGIQFGDHDNVAGANTNQILNMDVYGNGIQTGNPTYDQGCVNCGFGLYLASPDNIVDGNRVYDNRGGQLQTYTTSASGVDDNIIRNNLFDDSGVSSVISNITLSSADGTQFYNNIVIGSPLHGIIVQTINSNAGVYFNTIYGNAGTCIVVQGSSVVSTTIRNNICYGNGSDSISNTGTTTTSDHNLFTDPSFMNAALGEFHLTTGSAALPPCGIAVTGITVDFDDVDRPNPPSCGAYEVPSGSNPLDPLSEDFGSYAAASNICSANGGDGFTTSWNCATGLGTVETAPSGMTGNALRLNATSNVTVSRLFTAHAGVFSICATIRLSITNPNSYGIGFNLLNAAGLYQTSTYFNTAGNIVSDSLTLQAYSADTNYEACIGFDTAGQPNKYRTTINGGAASAWENCAQGACLTIAGIEINSYSTNAHTFWLDDITEDSGGGAGTITVATPTAGQICTSGSTCAVSWGSNGGLAGALTGIYYLVNGNDTPHLIASPDIASSPYSWTVNAPAGTTIKIRISQGAATDDSEEFTVLGTKVPFK